MAYVPSDVKRAFCFEENLGYIQDGMFMPVKLNEQQFKEIILEIISYENAASPDLILYNAIMRYTGVYVMGRVYKGVSKYDSEFYKYWKQYIYNLEEFKQKSVIDREKKKREYAVIKKARKLDSIKKSLTRSPKYTNT